MDKSNSNSDHSNLFLISSDSSRGQRPASARSYARFAKKVRQLLEVEDGNLEQLYLKVETIVKKFFHQHQVIEFKEMYECLAAIKTNSKKMNSVLNMLEKKIVSVAVKKDNTHKEANLLNIEDFKTTTSSQKDRNSSIHRQQNYEPKQRPKTLTDSTPSVNTSIKYNHIFKPAIKKDQINEDKFSEKYIYDKQQKSPKKQALSQYSPTKISAKNDEYQLRNKQYEIKVKEMMRELEQIKSKLNNPQTIEHKAINYMPTDLRLQLRQNEIDKQYSVDTNIQKCDISKKSDIFSHQKVHHQQGKSSNLSNNSSLINELSSKITSSNENTDYIFHQSVLKKNKEENNILRSEKESSIKAIMLDAGNITRTIEQLKQVASRLEIDSMNSINKGQSSLKSETSLLPPEKINELIKKASQEKSKNTEILQNIQVTTSQNRISEEMIPSFKNLAEKSTQFYKRVQQTPQFRREQQPKQYPNETLVIYRTSNGQKISQLGSSQVVQAFKPQYRQQPQHNISTIRYVYNPMKEPQIIKSNMNIQNNAYLNKSMAPKLIYPIQQQIPIYESQPIYRPVQMNINRNISVLNTLSSNNSSTSIMNHQSALSRHSHLHSSIQPNNKSVISNSISKIQPQVINPSNISLSFYQNNQQKASMGSKQLLSSSSSQSSLRRKGLNIITSFDKKI